MRKLRIRIRQKMEKETDYRIDSKKWNRRQVASSGSDEPVATVEPVWQVLPISVPNSVWEGAPEWAIKTGAGANLGPKRSESRRKDRFR